MRTSGPTGGSRPPEDRAPSGRPPRRPRPRRLLRAGNPDRRSRALFIGVFFVLTIFAAQLVRIQGFDAAQVAAEAKQQRHTTVAIPALRGRILSSDGVVLASSQERVTVVADQSAVCTYRTKKETCSPQTAQAAVAAAAADLAPLLGKTSKELVGELSGSSRYQVLARQATPLTWGKIRALGIPGIYKDGRVEDGASIPLRSYPQGTAAASLVGFVKQDGKAGGGVELMADTVLTGTTGQESYEVGGNGEIIPAAGVEVTPARNGRDVTLTLNSNIQWYAQNALAQKMQQTQALSGTVIVMNARTGALLAVASYPTFDPNDVGRATGSLVNTAFGEVFEPGSTAKLMVMAAALQEKKVTPDTPVIVPPQLPRYDRVFHDAEAHPTEYRTVAGVLAQSSNIGTVLVSETMSAKTLESYYRKFGVGAPSGLGFPGESPGLFAKSEDWGGTQRTTIAFGQGLSVTAIQAASVFQTIANGGVRIPPSLIAGTTAPDGDFIRAKSPSGTRVVDETVAAQVSAMLEGVASEEGTAPKAQIPGYRVAGKTGTADRYDPKVGGYSGKTASFIGYAPADDPQLVTAVILQRPIKGYYGGSVAAPVFHDVMTYALQELKIPPTGTTAPKITIEVDPAVATSDPNVLRDRRGR